MLWMNVTYDYNCSVSIVHTEWRNILDGLGVKIQKNN